MTESTDVAIIGAGPAGLAVGACLRKAGLNFIILEKNEQVGSSWRRHYERLHLHTIKRLSALPDLPLPATWPRYVPRKQVVAYLERYAEHFDLRPRFGEAVHAVRRRGGAWLVESASSSITARHVVIASGNNAEPVTPTVPGIETFRGSVIHSAEYVNAAPFAGQSVLVIGMGNTGAEIALDLAEGAARPTVSVRDGVHIVPRDLFGIPVQVIATYATGALPPRVIDAIFPYILDLALGRLEKYGIRRPKEGLLAQIARTQKIPVLDVGTAARIRSGAIRVLPGIAAVTADGAIFADGSEGKFDAIVFATGYRPNYRSFLEADPEETDPTIHFVGFRNPVTGSLREISREANRVAGGIATAR